MVDGEIVITYCLMSAGIEAGIEGLSLQNSILWSA